MLSILVGTVKNLMKLSQHCVGIEPSKNQNTINIFLASFECYPNSILFITLLNCRIKYFLTYSFSERFHYTIFGNRWHFEIFTCQNHPYSPGYWNVCWQSCSTNWFLKICFKFTLKKKWWRVWPLFNAHIICIHCTALSQSKLLLYPKNCIVAGFLEQV